MSDPARTAWTGLAAVGVAAFAVACCAGGPLLVAVAGSLAVEALIGVLAAVALLVVARGALYGRQRPRAKGPERTG